MGSERLHDEERGGHSHKIGGRSSCDYARVNRVCVFSVPWVWVCGWKELGGGGSEHKTFGFSRLSCSLLRARRA